MIQSYIRDPQTRELWDITLPELQSFHRTVTRGWIQTADTIRQIIREGDTARTVEAQATFEDWLYGNIHRLQSIAGYEAERNDYIMDAYLEWGVRNYPITDKITQHTLDGLMQMYDDNYQVDMVWDDYTAEIRTIIQYQTQRNSKAPQAMTREEMLRSIQSIDTDTLRKMLTAVEYQTKA
jgi:hypothetical protein